MLSEISQTQKEKYCIFCLYVECKKLNKGVKYTEIEDNIVTSSWERKKRKCENKGQRIQSSRYAGYEQV